MTGQQKRILVVDDEPLIAESLREALTKWEFEVTLTLAGDQAMQHLSRSGFDLVLTDIRMPNVTGMEILERVKHTSPATGVIIMTAYGTVEQAVQAMKIGAFDYLTKPFELDEVRRALKNFFRTRSIAGEVPFQNQPPPVFIGQSQRLQRVFEAVDLAAQCDAPVLIESESGTGKEVLASLIHHQSARRSKPYLKVNCAAFPENLIESQLFGHERGAFTGALRTTKGVFEAAQGGTLLLDEITEMSPHLQAKLLRVLQEGEITRVGSNQPIQTDVRVIATSNRDVQQAIESGAFREDLFFRLNVISVKIPPLRERLDDLPLLVQHFVEKFSQKYGRNIPGVDARAVDFLRSYHWPGNVRELENLVHRCVLSCPEGRKIGLTHVRNSAALHPREETLCSFGGDMSLEEAEKHLIRATLERHNYHKTRTAQILGITLKTLRNKMLQYGLESANA